MGKLDPFHAQSDYSAKTRSDHQRRNEDSGYPKSVTHVMPHVLKLLLTWKLDSKGNNGQCTLDEQGESDKSDHRSNLVRVINA